MVVFAISRYSEMERIITNQTHADTNKMNTYAKAMLISIIVLLISTPILAFTIGFWFFIPFVVLFACTMFICQMNEIETLIMIMVVTFGGAYFLLTDTIIENFRRYRAKSIAAVLLILSLSFLYSWQLSEASTSSIDVYGVIIFGLGLLALLDTAVNNYREMFRCLREDHKEELENYLKSVTEYYDVKFEQVENRISNIKEEWMFFADVWKKSPRKKKISIVLIILAFIAFFAGISFLSIKISGKMIWG